ncbi:hypothetical protein R3P38DRAFT_310837 [Favolaschia claudopus]|uniref:Uncharacterized protein n=1 Tax=Favolaschia claudopus TaxID=2862362 RepID=A0AAW0CT80_9AGAR
MSRWTQWNEDLTRLPEGVTRIGYDADTARYSFCDREGNLYLGPPHEEYGFLTLIGKTTPPPSAKDDRPQAFASEKSRPELTLQVPSSTFHDFLSPHVIASPSSAVSTLSSSSSPLSSAGSRLRDAVRRTALPGMANLVNKVRRSTPGQVNVNEKDGLTRTPSHASSVTLARSNTSSTCTTVTGSVMDEKIKFKD